MRRRYTHEKKNKKKLSIKFITIHTNFNTTSDSVWLFKIFGMNLFDRRSLFQNVWYFILNMKNIEINTNDLKNSHYLQWPQIFSTWTHSTKSTHFTDSQHWKIWFFFYEWELDWIYGLWNTHGIVIFISIKKKIVATSTQCTVGCSETPNQMH